MDLFDHALEETLMEMPYNSAMEFHRRYGREEPNARLGAACVHQTIDVARKAVALGAPKPRFLQDERHVAVVFDTQEAVVVLDPYLLHREPIRFPKNEVVDGASAVDVIAAPARRNGAGVNRDGRLNARYRATSDGYVIRLGYSKFSPARDQYSLSRHFTLRSDSLFDTSSFTDDLQGVLTHPEQTSLSIRAVLPGLQKTAEVILPLRGFAGHHFTDADLWLRSSDGVVTRNGDPLSIPLWDSLESVLTSSRAEIGEHLLSASRIYSEIADPDREVDPYSLENE
ncbi:hypothetical protein [Cryobacterium sp. TMT1-66-1]|uniref:hypothetical protein n=1 Tax=Cryobacterium sp. TMT1-66-1 TaxID=1259242 RepID=UPI001069D6D5|nr:hypothetical protein [Cryobacterium sp. TMT1-66-1]TFD06324.1 hypothetical protein E3T29_10680 [Cryobacterium sp. TMT1-66-1]